MGTNSENFRKITKSKNTVFAIALTWSILAVIGIPAIVLGAVWRLWLVMIPGIVFTASGFYGLTFVWLAFARRCRLRRVVYSVENENVRTVNDVAAHVGISPSDAKNDINFLIKHMFLVGYVFDGFYITLPTVSPENLRSSKVCPSCGAPVQLIGGKGLCEYCGTRIGG